MTDSGPSTPTEPSYDHLRNAGLYVDPELELAVPQTLEPVVVTALNNADVLVLPGDTDVGAEQVVEWLDADRLVALLGPSAEATWLEWVRSDAFAAAFDTRGTADSTPDPDLLVGYTRELTLSTSRYTWESGYEDRDVFEALDEALVDSEESS